MPASIVLDSVAKRYGPNTIVSDVSFHVKTGEIVGFLGPNGAGKTTTLRMIAGFTTPTAGRVEVCGFDMATHNTEAARHLGYLPERPPLYNALTVAEYLRFVAKAKGFERRQRTDATDQVISACQLERVYKREVFKLSKGYRQRVGLAQALLGEPEVLLLDEPTIGLDPEQLQQIREVIRKYGETHAVLFSTHLLPEVTRICHRVAIINHGKLLTIDTPAGLEAAIEQSNSIVLTVGAAGAESVLDTLQGVPGVERTLLVAEQAGRMTFECQIEDREGVEAAVARAAATRFDLLYLERRKATLENVFLHYVSSSNDSGASHGGRVKQ